MKRAPIDRSSALPWLWEVLRSSLSMAEVLLSQLSELQPDVVALVGDTVPPGRQLMPGTGGTGGYNPCVELAADIRLRWPKALLVVEMPLARPSDPFLGTSPVAIRTCGEEVYALASVNASADEVEQVLRMADPSSPYVALVALDSMQSELACPTDALRSGRLQPMSVIVGAFDGEGFLEVDIS